MEFLERKRDLFRCVENHSKHESSQRTGVGGLSEEWRFGCFCYFCIIFLLPGQ